MCQPYIESVALSDKLTLSLYTEAGHKEINYVH